MLSADAILSAKTSEAVSLLGRTAAEVAASFRKAARLWHPDVNPDPRAAEVFARLAELKDAALKRGPGAGTARRSEFTRADGTRLSMKTLASWPTDLGEVLAGPASVAWRFGPEWRDLADAEERRLGALGYADARMREELSRYLGRKPKRIDLEGGGTVLVQPRPADTVLMADLAAHLGRVPAVHVAWIVSSLLNLCCYLQWAGLVHGAIAPENVLVCPERHSAILAGGWGFSCRAGERPAALPSRTIEAMPRLRTRGQPADGSVDLALVKATGRELLGHSAGAAIRLDRAIPRPMADWLLSPSSSDAARAYGEWPKVLEASFGPRKFVPMGVSPEDVYRNAKEA